MTPLHCGVRFRASLLLVAAIAAGTPLLAPSRSAAASGAPLAAGQLIASSTLATLVLEPDGQVYGAGENGDSELTGSAEFDSSLTRLAGLPAGVHGTAVAAGDASSLVLGSNGVVYGAGVSEYGSLTAPAGSTVDTLSRLTGLPTGVRATRIAAGSNGDSVVLGNNGVVYGAGLTSQGTLTGNSGEHATLTPFTGLPAGVKATAIAVGAYHSLVLGSNGVAYGTGGNSEGQITGSEDSVATLTPLAGLSNGVTAVAIAAGPVDSLVIGSDGRVYGTGDNTNHQLTSSLPSTATELTPLGGLPSGVRAVAAAAGYYATVIIGSDGQVYGAGTNRDNQLSAGTSYTTLTLLTHGIPDTITEAAIGTGDVVLRDAEGVVYGTGDNSFSQLTTNAGSPQSAGFEVLAGQREVNVARPVISGTARFGRRLSAGSGQWSLPPDSYSYQWRANGAAIPGATGPTYQPSLGTIGLSVSVTMTARRGGFIDGTATSASTPRVAKGSALAYTGRPRPVVNGKPAAGHTLRLTQLTATGFTPAATSLSYQWLRNGAPIAHARKPACRITAADRGSHISVRVTAARAGYATGHYVTHSVLIR